MEVADNFPDQCKYVLETLDEVYKYDAQAREAKLSPAARLLFNQQHSKPVMDQLYGWLEGQFAQKLVGAQLGVHG